VTIQEIYLFLLLCVWITTPETDSSTGSHYRSGNTTRQDRLFHILRILHFRDNKIEPDKTNIMTSCGKRKLFVISSMKCKQYIPKIFDGNSDWNSDIKTRVKGDLTAIVCKNKQCEHVDNLHCPPAEGNFCDEYGNTMKSTIVQDYDRHMGYVNKSGRMTNSLSRCTWKWTKKVFLSFFAFWIYQFWTVLFSSCLVDQNFRLGLVGDLMQASGKVPQL
jgi:hypothetical protein